MRLHSKTLAALTALALVMTFVPALPAAAVVTFPTPTPGETQLNAVDFFDADNGWAVGGFQRTGNNYAVVERTTNGGTTWTRQTIAQVPYLKSVSFPSATVGYAVGPKEDTVYRTTDAGANWTALTVTSDPTKAFNPFESVRFTDEQHGFVVGQWSQTTAPVVWTTADGGDTWNRAFLGPSYLDGEGSPIGNGWFHGVGAYDASHAVTVGREDQLAGAIGYRLSDGVWTTESIPGIASLAAVSYLDASDAMAVGKGGKTARFDGSSWTVGAMGTADLAAVSLVDATHAWAVGTGGAIQAWTGGTWQSQESSTSVGLHGVSFDSTATGWAVGDGDTVLKTADGGTTWASIGGGTSTVTYESIEGAGRFDTAVAASKKGFPGTADTVVLAWGRNFPDALGGAALAGAYDAPLLLTEKDYVPRVVLDEIARLHATRVVLIGSTTVISDAVRGSLEPTVTVDRVFGGNRYETAANVATKTAQVLGAGRDDVFLAIGTTFPDALAASPAAFSKRWPILLTPATGLSPFASAVMTALGVKRVHVLGSSGAIPDSVLAELPAGITSDRWAGPTGTSRYATAVDIAAKSGLSYDGLAIATGENFPDALAGGVMQGKLGKVVLLTPTASLAPYTQAALVAHKPEIGTVRYLGSTSAVSATVRTAVSNLLK